MPGPVPTVIPDYGQDTWLQQELALYPAGWTDGPVEQAVLSGNAANLEIINQQIVYGWLASRIATAIGQELDYVSQDFFGNALPRQPGESDSTYRTQIQALLLQPQVTRQALSNILYRLTGVYPRMMEPWYIPDTCAWDSQSYWDIDTVENAFRWASPELRYQGFVETPLPPFSGNGGNPVWAFDDGFSWDTGPSCWLDVGDGWFIGEEQIDNALVTAHAFGTIIWRKFISAAAPFIVGGTLLVDTGATQVNVTLNQTQPYLVLLQASWDTTAYVQNQGLGGFDIEFGTAAPSGGMVDYMIIPNLTPDSAFVYVPGGNTSDVVDVPPGFSGQIIVTPNWNTVGWLAASSSSSRTIDWDQAAPNPMIQPNSGFAYYLFPPADSGSQTVPHLATSAVITLPDIQTSPFVAFVLPSWDTECGVTKTSSTLTVNFSSAAPLGASVGWAIFSL